MPTSRPRSPLLHQTSYRIRSSEIGVDQLMRPDALLLLFHETAMQHVIQLGISLWDMIDRQLTWVVLEQRLEWIQRPKMGDQVTVLTGPAGFDRLYTFRDYRLLNAQGELLAWSSSKWILMHTDSRRPQRLTPEVLALEKHLPPPADRLSHPIKLPEWPLVSHNGTYSRAAHLSELDFNHHLSNAAYVRWMLDGLAPNQMTNFKNIHLRFGHEILYGQWINAETTQLADGSFRMRLLDMNRKIVHGEAWTELLKQ